jgi:spore germination cell wall hydrolase CwlJ-like protein
MVYYEARSLPKSEWLHVAAVAVHRSKTKGFPKTVCAVVKHREFTTSKYFGGFKKDKEVYKQIKVAISDNLSKLKTPHLFFSSNRKGRMRFH